jgi:hypothetical protein
MESISEEIFQRISRGPKRVNYQKALRNYMGEKPIAYSRGLAKMARSVVAAVFMSQLLHWWGKGGKPGWVYKTIKEMYEETGLTRRQQETAIRIWKKLGGLEVKLMGIPPKRHFKVKWERLEILATNLDKMSEKFD